MGWKQMAEKNCKKRRKKFLTCSICLFVVTEHQEINFVVTVVHEHTQPTDLFILSPLVLSALLQVSLPTGTPSAGGIGPVGSLSTATNKVVNSGAAFDIREMARSLNELLPTDVKEMNKVVDKYTRGLITGGTLFEELGMC